MRQASARLRASARAASSARSTRRVVCEATMRLASALAAGSTSGAEASPCSPALRRASGDAATVPPSPASERSSIPTAPGYRAGPRGGRG